MHYLLVLFIGITVSFLGTLPLGNLSITAMQIGIQENKQNAWKYAVGAAFIEIAYLRLSLTGVDWIMQHNVLFKVLGWLTVIVFLVLGIMTFISAIKQSKDKKALLLNNKLDRFLLGLSMSALNPAQIPFWFLWSSYLVNNKLLSAGFTDFNYFTIGAGLGTIAGLALYIHGGAWLIKKMNAGNNTINKFLAIIFIVSALIQLYKMMGG